MKSKAPLALMEQIIMVLVFALAAGLCMQLFVFSGKMSRRNAARDRAALAAETAAEALKSADNDPAAALSGLGAVEENGSLVIRYDAFWQPTAENGEYVLTVTPEESGDPLLGKASVEVRTASSDSLIRLTAAWQTEGGAR